MLCGVAEAVLELVTCKVVRDLAIALDATLVLDFPTTFAGILGTSGHGWDRFAPDAADVNFDSYMPQSQWTSFLKS